MKCPDCGNQVKAKLTLRCTCGYQFAFNPKVDKLTDGHFLAVARSASSNDAYYFTLPQFHAEHRRKQWVSPGWTLAGCAAIVAVGGGICFFAKSGIPLFVSVVIAVVFFASRLGKHVIAYGDWINFTNRWLEKKGPKGLEKLITAPRLQQPPPEWSEPDIYDYGFERLIIVERDELVDLFVLNNLHAEQRALVIAESGYPNYLLAPAAKTLAANPNLPVYLLHDATPEGEQMHDRILNWPHLKLSGHPLTDLGLFRRDVSQMSGLKKIGADKDHGGVHVDLIRYGTLSAGLAMALDQQVALATLMEPDPRRHDTTSGGGFG